jgi:hypothetical protein
MKYLYIAVCLIYDKLVFKSLEGFTNSSIGYLIVHVVTDVVRNMITNTKKKKVSSGRKSRGYGLGILCMTIGGIYVVVGFFYLPSLGLSRIDYLSGINWGVIMAGVLLGSIGTWIIWRGASAINRLRKKAIEGEANTAMGLSEGIIYCRSCRTELPKGSEFCLYCGARLERPSEREEAILSSTTDYVSKWNKFEKTEEEDWRYCPRCGEVLSQGANYCPNCCYQLRHSAREVINTLPQSAPEPQPTSYMALRRERQASITAAAILFFLFGVLGTIGSLYLIGGSVLFGLVPLFGLAGVVPGMTGIAWLLISIFNIVAGFELWRSRKIGGKIGIASMLVSIGGLVMMAFLPMLLIQDSHGIGTLALAILGSSLFTPIILLVTLNLVSMILLIIGWRSLV